MSSRLLQLLNTGKAVRAATGFQRNARRMAGQRVANMASKAKTKPPKLQKPPKPTKDTVTKPKPKPKTFTNTPKSKSKGGVYSFIGNQIKQHPLGAAGLGLYLGDLGMGVVDGMEDDLYTQVIGPDKQLDKGLGTNILQGLKLIDSDEKIKDGRLQNLKDKHAADLALIKKWGGPNSEELLTFNMTDAEAAAALSTPLYDAQLKQSRDEYKNNPQVIEAREERVRQNRLEEEALRRQTAREDFLMNEQVIQRMQDNRRQRNDSLAGLAAVFAALAAG